MGALPAIEQKKVVPFKVIDGKTTDKKKYNLDGSIKRTHSNKVAGESSEVFAFRTEEEIKAMIDVFDKHIADAPDEEKEKIACRNKLLFLIGMNVGIRASDLRTLKWSFFYNDDGTFKESYRIQPEKQRKQHKFITMYFNATVKKAIENYVSEYPIEDINSYLFPSRKGTEAICVSSLWRIIKEAAFEAGISQNIGSHSLRKSWGFWCWHKAEDKNKALVILQMCFNHSSTQTTARYIGITDNEISDMYNSIDLGLAFI